MDNTQITDAGLKDVAKLLRHQNYRRPPKGKSSTIKNTQITDAGLNVEASSEALFLNNEQHDQITDAGLMEVEVAETCFLYLAKSPELHKRAWLN